jgi:diacylglycerol O-acyltransferase / wax synthase
VSAEPLSAADRGALQAEVGPVNMAVAGAMLFDAGTGTTYEAVCARVQERLHLLPRYRQKLRDPLGPLTNPVWIDDDGFDLHWHIRHARLPGAGSRAELADYVAREMATRLHRDRPLWELHVIDGLEGDRVALLAKMHHALVDGIAAIGIGIILLDPTPEPMPIEGADVEWAPRPFDPRRHLVTGGLTFARGLVDRALETSPRDLLKAPELAAELARQRPQAPMTPLNRPISPNRRYAMRAADLATIKAAGRAAGGTVNDVILAVVAGALRRYLRAAGADLRGRDPVALVPVNIRSEKDPAAAGNRLSTVFVDLPAAEEELDARIDRVGAQMRALRESAAVRAGAVIAGAAGQAPPLVASLMVRATGAVRAMNLVVSNVPGPQQTFYMNGQPLLEVYPAVPLNPANQGLNVGVMSYDGRVFFGLCADARLDPGLDVVADALDAELEALRA